MRAHLDIHIMINGDRDKGLVSKAEKCNLMHIKPTQFRHKDPIKGQFSLNSLYRTGSEN